MMMSFSENEKIPQFGKYKKAKYELIINSYKDYFFVTTCRSEEECIKILEQILETKHTVARRNYKIIKKTEEGSKIIKKGSLPPLL